MGTCEKFSLKMLSGLILLLLSYGCGCELLDLDSPDEEFKLGSSSLFPSIWENRIVWEGNEGGREEVDTEIYMYDISSQKIKRITPLDDGYFGFTPKIFGDYIVYLEQVEVDTRTSSPQGDKEPPYALVLLNINSPEKKVILEKEGMEYLYTEASIYGDWVVYNRISKSEGSSIILYQISSHVYTNLTEGEGGHSPVIFKNTVCWKSARYINCYYIDSGEKIALEFENIIPEELDIYEDLLVFSASLEGPGKYQKSIYIYNLSTENLQRISFPSAAELDENPKIHNNVVVWERSLPNGLKSIFMFDLNTYETKIIRTAKDEVSIPQQPDIWGNYVVWIETDVTLFNIETGEITHIDF